MSAKELMVIAKQKYEDLMEKKPSPETRNAETQTDARDSTDDLWDERLNETIHGQSVYGLRSPLDSLPGLHVNRKRKKAKTIKLIPY